MRGKKLKLIKKYVELTNMRDERDTRSISGTLIKRNPLKYMKQLYSQFNADQKRKFSIVVDKLVSQKE